MTVMGNARHLRYGKNEGERVATHRQTRASARVFINQYEQDTAVVVVGHHSEADRALPAFLWCTLSLDSVP